MALTATPVDNGNGTATVTIAGAISPSDNVDVYTSVNGQSWTYRTTRSGNGAVTFALGPGLYFVYAQDLNVLVQNSVPLAFSMSSAADAPYESMDCWLYAVREHLRANVALLNTNNCEITPGGRPHPRMGEVFVGIDGLGTTASGLQNLKEEFVVGVTITRRTGRHPADRRQGIYFGESWALTTLERQIVRAINWNETIRAAANSAGGLPNAGRGDAFQQPLHYNGQGPIEMKGPEWVFATANTDETFVSRVLRFSGGLRVQDFDVMH